MSENYIRERLLFDVFVFLPFGYLGTLIDIKLRVLWYIKCLRMKYLTFLFKSRLFQPIILYFIEIKQSFYLKDKEKRKETNEDLIFITLKIFAKNVMRIVSLIIKIAFIVYFMANLWFVFVYFHGDAIYEHERSKEEGELYPMLLLEQDTINPSFLINDNWNIR